MKNGSLLQSHDENKEKERQMVKAAISFEDVALVKGHKKRNQLVNRNVFFGTGSNFWNSIYDQLCSIYDMNSIKHIWGFLEMVPTGSRMVHMYLDPTARDPLFSLDKFQFLSRLLEESQKIKTYMVSYAVPVKTTIRSCLKKPWKFYWRMKHVQEIRLKPIATIS